MSNKQPTTIRLDPTLKKAITTIAKEKGLTFSQAVSIALQALANGTFFLSIGLSEYSDEYIEKLDEESKEHVKQFRKGKVKGYTSGQEMVNDILQN